MNQKSRENVISWKHLACRRIERIMEWREYDLERNIDDDSCSHGPNLYCEMVLNPERECYSSFLDTSLAMMRSI